MSLSRGVTVLVLGLGRLRTLNQPIYQNDIYLSIKGLPFDKFLELYLDNRYMVLDKSGKSDPLQCVKQSEIILAEFSDACADDVFRLRILIEIGVLESKISRIKLILNSLNLQYNDELLSQLKQLGVHDIDIAETVIKRLELELDTQVAELNKVSTGKAPTYETFVRLLTEFSPTMKASDIDTYHFCILAKKLRERNKALEDKHGRGKNR